MGLFTAEWHTVCLADEVCGVQVRERGVYSPTHSPPAALSNRSLKNSFNAHEKNSSGCVYETTLRCTWLYIIAERIGLTMGSYGVQCANVVRFGNDKVLLEIHSILRKTAELNSDSNAIEVMMVAELKQR